MPTVLRVTGWPPAFGAADNKEPLLGGKAYVEGNDFLALGFERGEEPGVAGVIPFHLRPVGQGRERCFDVFGIQGLCVDEIELGGNQAGVEDGGNVRAQLRRERHHYAGDFAVFLHLEFAQAVVGLHHFGRLDKHGFTRCGLVVDNALNLALVHRADGYDHTAVAHGGRGVGVNKPLGHGGGHYAAHGRGD